MCCLNYSDWIIAFSSAASAYFAFRMKRYAKNQTQCQKNNLKVVLYKERFRIYEPIVQVQNIMSKGVYEFFKVYISENQNSQYPICAVEILNRLKDQRSLFMSMFSNEVDFYDNYVNKYTTFVDKACELCSYLPKIQQKRDTYSILIMVAESKDENTFHQKFDNNNIPTQIKGLYNEFCELMKEWNRNVDIKSFVHSVETKCKLEI